MQDPEKFVNGLPEMHSFGTETSTYSPVEELDEKTWLERFHDWKHRLWSDWRQVLRGQISHETRQALLEKQSGLARRSRIVGVAQFAQVPLLNDKQLVARWRQQMPMTFVSDSQSLPIDPLPPGMYLVEATDAHLKAYTILMVSRTVLVTRGATSSNGLLAFAVDRSSGAPIAGANVTVGLKSSPMMHGITGIDGLATFKASAPGKAKPADENTPDVDADSDATSSDKLWVMARSGGDVALVAPWYSFTNGEQSAKIEYYTYTDRPVYRPGHVVHWKSIIREYSGNALALPSFKQVHVEIHDAADKTVYEKDLPLSAMGTVSGDLTLPADSALGGYTVQVKQDKDQSYASDEGSFQVEDYRKPEYQVRVSVDKARVLQGSSNQATIDARYFFGEPVTTAKVKYTIHQSTHYWWNEADDDSGPGFSSDTPEDNDANAEADTSGAEELEQTGKLNADGKLIVKLPTRFIADDHNDKDYVVEAGVTDDAGREITGRYRFLATYGSYRIHVEPVSYIARKGQPSAFMVTALDYDNKPVRAHIHLHLKASQYAFHQSTVTDIGDADTDTGADGKGTVQVPITSAGFITVTASSETPEHRSVQSTTWLYVAGNETISDDSTGDDQTKIIADKKSYAPGDVAHLTIASNLDNIHALITATGYTTEFTRVIAADGKSLTFDLPITRDSQPNLTVDAVFIQNDKIYQAHKNLKVPPTQQQLQIEITPVANIFQPQQAATYDVMARDSKGQSVSAELSFSVVDEAIYSLYPDISGDIVKRLYPDRYVSSSVDSSLDYYFSGSAGDKSPLLAERRARYRPQLAQVKPSADAKAPHIRKDFPDTAFWQPAVHTDSSGHARVTLTFPDSLTTWRATARAITADSKAGSTVNRVIVRKNIIVRMGQPRFLRKGDTVSVPVIVHNYMAESKSIQLSLAATGVDIVGGAPQQVSVSPKGEATAIFKLHATAAGTATLTAKALSTGESDALQISLPVRPSGVRKSINAAGAIANNGDRTLPVNFPANTDASVHTLSVEVSPSIAGTMFSALDYLTAFPYGCTEQTMSSFLPNIIVGGAVNKLHLQGRVNQASLQAKVDAGFARLSDYQHDDGGWGWWKEDKSQVFMTAYVISGLGEARSAGFALADGENRKHGVDFLQATLRAHPRLLPELRAYVIYALGEVDTEGVGLDMTMFHDQLDTLYNRRNDLSPQTLAFTGLAMLHVKDGRASEIAKLLESKAQQQGEQASWRAGRNELLDVDYDASAETTAFALKFLVAADPQSSLLPKAAQWLVANRNQGYWWSSTQQTAFVLFGLTDYLVASHELSGDTDAEVFVNNVSAGRRHFTQADALSGATLKVDIDAAHLQQNNAVHIVTHSAGRSYFTVTGSYFSTDKTAYQQGAMALNITRDYFLLKSSTTKDNNIVYNLEPLRGPVQQGDVLAVHIGISGSPAKYLLIEDPIPAGTEFLQNEQGYNIVSRPYSWDWWYTRREFHDDHAAIFAESFSGRHESFYLLKVVNPGSFTISPASVQPMYQPDVQATTDELHLDVKDVQ